MAGSPWSRWRKCKEGFATLQEEHVEFAMKDEPQDDNLFKQRLKNARELREMSQAKLSEKSGLPPSSIAHFEAGTRKPSFESLRSLANALQVTTDYLIGRMDTIDGTGTDRLHRHMAKLSAVDLDMAEDFIQMLAKRNADSKKGE
jgi:transcriptional regulator with XRE-family HTH domain